MHLNTERLIKISLLLIAIAVITLCNGRIFGYYFNKEKKEVVASDSIVEAESLSIGKDDGKKDIFLAINKNYNYHNFDKTTDAYYLYNKDKVLLSYVLFTSPYCDSIKGFGGSIPFAIVFNNAKKIELIYLLPNSETPSWIERLKKIDFLNLWNGLTCSEALDKHVDAVSGATLSSNAIIKSLQHRLSKFAEVNLVKKKESKIIDVLAIIAAYLVFIFALLSYLFPHIFGKYRIILLLSSIGILGFWLGDFLSISLINNWLMNGLNYKSHFFLFVVFILSILLPLLTNKSFYCQYLCPFGALQELTGKINKRKIILSPNLIHVLKYIKYVYLLFLIVLISISIDLSVDYFEPFSAFKFQFSSLSVLLIAIISLFLSIFIAKPWCRFVCPTGALLSCFTIKTDKKSKLTFSLILNIFLFLLVISLSYLCVKKNQTPEVIVQKEQKIVIMNNTLDVIQNRKSVRTYTEQAVTKEQIDTLLHAAMAAPSARNMQPWIFIVVTEREKLDKLAEGLPNAKMLFDAKAAIIVAGDLSDKSNKVSKDFWVQDCSAATQNILLAAEAIGLGAVWTAAFPSDERMKTVRKVINLPKNIIPLNVIPIGYPTGEEKPKNKWNPDKIFWNKYEAKKSE